MIAKLLAVAAPVALLAFASAPADAAPALSKVRDDYISPVSLSIARGGSVKWVWAASNLHPHNVRLAKAPRGVGKHRFRSPTRTGRFSFVRAFTIAGSYRFLCTLHPFTMRQTVTVRR